MEENQKYEVQVKLFGSLQLENQFGIVKEPNRNSQSWQILKYLLVNRGLNVSQAKLLEELWQETEEEGYNHFRVRLSRLRSALNPIKLGGRNGLVLSDDSYFDINTDYDIQTDVDHFKDLMERIRALAEEDQSGLLLCAEALKLYRGKYMERTTAPWAEELQVYYHEEFRFLVQTTLDRMITLKDPLALPILSSRVAALIPEDRKIQDRIAHFAASIEDSPEQIRHVNGVKKLHTQPLQKKETVEHKIDASESIVRIRLLGLLELENELGTVGETANVASQSWLFLKYLLVNQGREISQAELLNHVWPNTQFDTGGHGDGALRVYLSRLRSALKPLHLDGKKGLVRFVSGYYSLSADHTIQTDESFFYQLLDRILNTPPEQQKGLLLCTNALELCRGMFLANTKEAPWLMERRKRCSELFCILALDTLKRMRTLDDISPISLLSRRALVMVPNDEAVQHEIIRFMVDHKLQKELLYHLTCLACYEGIGVEWLSRQGRGEEASANGAEVVSPDEEHAVAIRMFGPVELENQFGRIVEEPDQTPEIWMLLKYLLIHREEEMSEDKVAEDLLQDVSEYNVGNTLGIRRRRLRTALEPLHLDGAEGLIRFVDGVYSLNRDYVLQTDEERFEELMLSVRSLQETDTQGLEACKQALELYRGEFMQYGREASWLTNYREYYREEFFDLARCTLQRSKALNDDSAMDLLGQRSAMLAPEEEELHMEILSHMIDRKLQSQLERYIYRLARHNGPVTEWLDRYLA